MISMWNTPPAKSNRRAFAALRSLRVTALMGEIAAVGDDDHPIDVDPSLLWPRDTSTLAPL
jgi:hypothetical protein